jgi:hypothetical protein
MLDFFFIFSLIFGYKLGLVDYSILLPSCILLLVLIVKNNNISQSLLLNKVLINRLLPIIYFLMAIFLISVFSYIVNREDFVFEYILKPIRNIFLIFIVYTYVRLRGVKIEKILILVLLSITVHSIVIYLQYILYVMDLSRDFLYHPSLTVISPIRKVGLSTGFPSAGLIIVMASLIAVYLSFRTRKYKYILLLFLITPSVFVTARSSMYIYIVLVPTFLLYLSILYKKYLSVITYFVILFCMALIVYSLSFEFPEIQGSIDKMFLNLVNYIEYESFHDNSTKHLVSSEHLYLSDSVKDFLIGNSQDRGSGFQQSDISYVRILTGQGVFVLILYVTAYFYMYHASQASIKILFDRPLGVLLGFLYVALFIMSFKGHYVFSRIVGDIILIISISFLSNSYTNSKEE